MREARPPDGADEVMRSQPGQQSPRARALARGALSAPLRVAGLCCALAMLRPPVVSADEPTVAIAVSAAVAAALPQAEASVAAQVAAEFEGPGQPGLALLLDTKLPERWRLAYLRGRPEQPGRLDTAQLKVPWAQRPARLAARDVNGDGRPELVVTGGLANQGQAYQVFEVHAARLTTVLQLRTDGEGEWRELDAADTGRKAIVQIAKEQIWLPALGLADYRVEPYAYDGRRFVAAGWRLPQTASAQHATQQAIQHLAARLCAPARTAAEEAARLEPSADTHWNLWLATLHAELFLAQQVRLAQPANPEARLAAVAANVLVGDYARAAETLLAFAGPQELPAGWQVPLRALAAVVGNAFQVAPELQADPRARLVQALVLVANGDAEAGRRVLLRARADSPDPETYSRWLLVGVTGARLVYLGPGERLQQVDLASDGRPTGSTRIVDQLGRLRSVAATAVGPAVAYVPEAGNRVVVQGAAGPPRTVLSGEFLYLSPQAFSPDGRHLAIDSGTSTVRKLTIVELADGRALGNVTYAGGFLWAPDGKSLVVEIPVRVDPPLPWADGGSRDLRQIALDGRELARLATGDASSVWAAETWDAPNRLLASVTRYRRGAGQSRRPAAVERYLIDPLTRKRTVFRGHGRPDADRQALMRKLKLPAEAIEIADLAYHPRFILFRQRTEARTELGVMARDAEATPYVIGPAPPLSQPLAASWAAVE